MPELAPEKRGAGASVFGDGSWSATVEAAAQLRAVDACRRWFCEAPGCAAAGTGGSAGFESHYLAAHYDPAA